MKGAFVGKKGILMI